MFGKRLINTGGGAAGYTTDNLALDFVSKDLTTGSTTWTDRQASKVLTKSGSTVYNSSSTLVDFTGGYWGNDSLIETLKDGSGDFSVEFYGELNFSADYMIVAVQQTPSISAFNWRQRTAGIQYFNYKNGTNDGSQVGQYSGKESGNNHIILIWDTSLNVKAYINNVLQVTDTAGAGGTQWTSIDGMRIGSWEQDPAYASSNMKMGVLRFYKGQLNSTEIENNYDWAIANY